METYMEFLKRRTADFGKAGPGASVDGTGMMEMFPATYEFLTATRWDEKTERQVGTIMLLCELGMWKAWLHDRDGKCGCFVSSRTYQDLLLTVEETLANGSGEWRPDNKVQTRR